MISCQDEPYPKIPQHPKASEMTFTDCVIALGVAMVRLQRWCDHVDGEIARRVKLIDATRA